MRLIFTFFISLFSISVASSFCPPPSLGGYIEVAHLLRQQLVSANLVLNPNAEDVLKLRIKKNYEIFDNKGKLVLKGSAKEIDISGLSEGKYTIKFDKDYNQIEYFTKK